MTKKILALAALILCAIIAVSGCSSPADSLDPKNPVTVTMWHNYGGQMKDSMEALVEEFNNTVGLESGVVINVTSIAASKEQNEKLISIANGDPGAPEMPDTVTAYPATASKLLDAGLITSLDGQFSAEELSAYMPQFVDEGRLPDGKLYVFPVAKSTEVLFVNRTLFDRFSAQTGVRLDSLATFEGIADAAERYYEWSDSQTPDVKNDGKTFFTADSWFNIAMVGSLQLGSEFINGDMLNYSGETFKRIWDFEINPAISGCFAVTDGYSSDLSKTGDIVCSTGSTAGILFYGDTITYPDNVTEKVEYAILPYPTFDGGKKVALQRGAGMVVAKSNPQKERAASIFLKWFTEPAQNIRLVTSSGYLPVTAEAYEKMASAIETADNLAVKLLLEAATKMAGSYEFTVAPNTANFSQLSSDYEKNIKMAMSSGRAQVSGGGNPDKVSGKLFTEFTQ